AVFIGHGIVLSAMGALDGLAAQGDLFGFHSDFLLPSGWAKRTMALVGLRPLRGRRSVPGRGPGRKIPIIQCILPQLCKYRQPPTPGGRARLDPPRLFQYSRENAPGARFLCPPPGGTTKSAPSPAPAPGRAARNPCGNCPKNLPFSLG